MIDERQYVIDLLTKLADHISWFTLESPEVCMKTLDLPKDLSRVVLELMRSYNFVFTLSIFDDDEEN